MTEAQILVGLAEVHIGETPSVFSCIGLGSCIGFCAYDPITQIGGMAHLMLPSSRGLSHAEAPAKYVDLGIPHLIDLLLKQGAMRSHIRVAYVGGAQLFKSGLGTYTTSFDVGLRNQSSTEEMITKLNLRCIAKDAGGNRSRNITFDTNTGNVYRSHSADTDKLLCSLSLSSGKEGKS